MPQEIQHPKLSAVLNNCSLHALTPEIKQEILQFGQNEAYDNQHNLAYHRLKQVFAKTYELNPETFTWKAFAQILKNYNAFDTQIILGLALRVLMKETIASNEFLEILASCAQSSPEDYVNSLTNINQTTGRYDSLSPDQVFTYVSHDLGLSLEYHSAAGNQQQFKADKPIALVKMYHQGGIDGAGSGGHWERTPQGMGTENYQIHGSTQLDTFLFLLGTEDPLLGPYGLSMVVKHVNLTAQSLMNGEIASEVFLEFFMELNCSALQIEQYLFNIKSVPQELAVHLLGKPLTATTQQFINTYPFQEVGNSADDNLMTRYLTAVFNNDQNKPHLGEGEEEIMARLLIQPPLVPTRDLEFKASEEECKMTPSSSKAAPVSAESKASSCASSLFLNKQTVHKRVNENDFNATRTYLLAQARSLSTKLGAHFGTKKTSFFSRVFSKSTTNPPTAKDLLYSQQIALLGSLTNILQHMKYDEDISQEIQSLKASLFDLQVRTTTPALLMEVQYPNLSKQMLIKNLDIQILITSIEALSKASTEYFVIEEAPSC